MSVIGLPSGSVRSARVAGKTTDMLVHEIEVGYAIHTECRPGRDVLLMQYVSMVFGVLAIVGAGLLAIVPTAGLGSLTWGIIVILLALATLMFDFARQRTQCEFEVDLGRRELREIGRNRSGGTRVVDRYGFDAVSGLFIDQRRGQSALVLRLGQSERVLPVAMGTREELAPLARRLGQDVLGVAPAVAAKVSPRRPVHLRRATATTARA